MAILESESRIPMFTNTAISWSNRSKDLFMPWNTCIILTEIKLITGWKILKSKIKEHMIRLEQFDAGKIIHIPLDLTNPDVLNRGLEDRIEESLVNVTFPVAFTLNKQAITFFGMNPDMLIV